MPRLAPRAALLLLVALLPLAAPAAPRRESLLYGRFDVDPGEWRYFEFPAKEASRLEVRFEAESASNARDVRVRLLRDQDFARYREKQTADSVGATPYRRRGRLSTRLAPGSYVVVVEGRPAAGQRTRVELEVTLLPGPDPEDLPVAYASPQRRLVVVTVSLGVFALILVAGGGALWRAARAGRR